MFTFVLFEIISKVTTFQRNSKNFQGKSSSNWTQQIFSILEVYFPATYRSSENLDLKNNRHTSGKKKNLNVSLLGSCHLRKEILSTSSGELIKTGMRESTTGEWAFSQSHT